jgi:hypothetical protein
VVKTQAKTQHSTSKVTQAENGWGMAQVVEAKW